MGRVGYKICTKKSTGGPTEEKEVRNVFFFEKRHTSIIKLVELTQDHLSKFSRHIYRTCCVACRINIHVTSSANQNVFFFFCAIVKWLKFFRYTLKCCPSYSCCNVFPNVFFFGFCIFKHYTIKLF